VTDRQALAVPAPDQMRLLLEKIASAAQAGVDWIQIREKDLTARELAALVRDAVRRVPRSCGILVNDRLDVAAACGASGVHLGEKSISADEAKQFVRGRDLRGDFFVGVSVHSPQAAQQAEREGANYVIFGPVYETPSKAPFGPPQGIERLEEVCRTVAIPVIAIGGISLQNAAECLAAGASGIAAIRLFQDATDIAAVTRTLRSR
jgi:thiamine-phosphate pyrophosphorylase